jgi:peptidoglycan/xylan/chitin deacetylase (PgdA/CDA1 family)
MWRMAKIAALALLLVALPAAGGVAGRVVTARGAPYVLVFVYHQVAPPDWPLKNGDVSITPAHLAADLAYLDRHHIQTLTAWQFRQYMAGRLWVRPGAVFLTFDNGLEGVYRFALPLLERYRVHATLFVVGGRTTRHTTYRERKFLSWTQLRRMIATGWVSVQSETYALHRQVKTPLGSRPAVLPFAGGQPETAAAYRARLAADFAAQDRAFLRNLGYRPTLLVWPFSTSTTIAQAAAAQAGIVDTFTVRAGFARPGQTQDVPRNGASVGWEYLSLSIPRLRAWWAHPDQSWSLHYLWGDPRA